ncbi:MAG TPA: condensation domain-containing protein, partial [Thermoanaerobaculia bacterium]|nr:condensation domain-containing protein [Thermoanaerobaculia bacterium]
MSENPATPERGDLTPERRRLLELMLEERRRRRSLRTRVLPRGEDEPLELSFAQQRLWFIQQLQPGVAAYNIPSAVRLTGPLDVAVLDRAIQEIVRRHETLRTRFGFEDGRPVPVIAAEHRVPLEVEDLTAGRGPEEAAAEAQRKVDTLARRPYDLAADDLLRVHLLKVGEDDHVLLVVLHHIVSDTWTTGVFLREVAALYGAFAQGRPSPLPELALQYSDYASWQRRLVREEGLESEVAYWKERLSHAPPLLELPTDRPRPPVQSFRGGREMLLLPKSLVAALKELGGSEDASLFMVLLAGFQTLLHRYTGQTDIPVGSPIANRDRVELEGMIGLFVNTLVLRSDLSGDPTFRELLRQVRETSLGAFAHKELPFEKVVEELDLDRDVGRNPLFQVLFAFQNVPLPALEAQGLTLTRYEFNESTSRLDLELDLQEMPYGFVGWIGYNADLFDGATVARMTAHYVRLLEAAAADADRPLSAVPLLDEADRRQVVAGWNATAREYAGPEVLTARLAAQAAATPEATALICAEERPTYADFEARVCRLARHLGRLGIGPESRVGVFAERGVEMVEAIHAV